MLGGICYTDTAISRPSGVCQDAVVFVVAAVVVFVFVGRSGHTAGVPVPAIEIKLRAFLEQVMYARPREKNFSLVILHLCWRLWRYIDNGRVWLTFV